MFKEILNFLRQLTWKKYGLSTIAVLTSIVLFTVYENRQSVYESTRLDPVIHGDWPLTKPRNGGNELLRAFLNKYPEIALVTVIDADPVKNQRFVIHREYNNPRLKEIINAQELKGNDGTSPMFTSNAQENDIMLGILLGEIRCESAKGAGLDRIYTDIGDIVAHSCRIPLPPAYQKVTGWLSIHFDTWPPRDFDKFKQDALTLALEYYSLEIQRDSK